jgi:hypothetical protein
LKGIAELGRRSNVDVALVDKDDLTMRQRDQQPWQPVNASTEWLCNLVDTFEQAEQLGDVRCDDQLLSEMRARLARPALPRNKNLQFQAHH